MTVRQPAVAGLFYPADPRECAATVDALISATPPPSAETTRAKAFVVPHAGYIYSGPVAATAYAALLPRRDEITRVVLLGPAHRVRLDGLALPAVDAFRTPLGVVPIDDEARGVARMLPGVVIDDRPHAEEHSLEVQLPFLQRVLASFTLVPFVVGHADASDVARVVDALWGGPETVVLVSSDLSHYESYTSAARHDRATADSVLAGAADEIGPYDACGAYPLRGLLGAARHHALEATLLDLRSSGDTAGPRDQVVGYGAFALTPAGAS